MILSHRWRFIFIKGQKVAGTSVEMALAPLCGPDDVVTPITARDEAERFRMGGQCRNYAVNPDHEPAYRNAIALYLASSGRPDLLPDRIPGRPRFYNHMPLTEVLAAQGGDLRDYRIFGVERSPYAKALSWANMLATYADYEAGLQMRAELPRVLQFLDTAIADNSILAVRNIDRYRGPDGAVAATILRYGELPGALHRHLAELGVAALPPLPHAKKGLMSDTLDLRATLRPDHIEALNNLFADEFTTFGYPVLRP